MAEPSCSSMFQEESSAASLCLIINHSLPFSLCFSFTSEAERELVGQRLRLVFQPQNLAPRPGPGGAFNRGYFGLGGAWGLGGGGGFARAFTRGGSGRAGRPGRRVKPPFSPVFFKLG